MSDIEVRRHQRDLVETEMTVNDGHPYAGGRLHDMSVGGAAVMYPEDTVPTGEPVVPGQILFLNLPGVAKMPARVARVFDGGYAAKFDFSIPKSPKD